MVLIFAFRWQVLQLCLVSSNEWIMAKNKLHTFVLHDESVNTHGFRMLTSGADLTEFLKNPVMILNHDDWELPIGRWVNIRIEEDKIVAEADFDLGDERGREVARKVSDGYIRACSIGAWAVESSNAPEVLLPGQTLPTVTKWQVREASICTIGANHNALALYDAYGGKINMESKTDIETIIQLIDNPSKRTENTMNKELLKLLSLSDNATEQEAVRAVEKLQLEKQELQDQLSKIEKAEAEARLAEATELVDGAIQGGQLHASARESLLRLFELDFEGAKATLEALPKTRSITEQLQSQPGEHKLANMSWDELDKSGKLPELRDSDPKLYEEKYNEHFKTNK